MDDIVPKSSTRSEKTPSPNQSKVEKDMNDIDLYCSETMTPLPNQSKIEKDMNDNDLYCSETMTPLPNQSEVEKDMDDIDLCCSETMTPSPNQSEVEKINTTDLLCGEELDLLGSCHTPTPSIAIPNYDASPFVKREPMGVVEVISEEDLPVVIPISAHLLSLEELYIHTRSLGFPLLDYLARLEANLELRDNRRIAFMTMNRAFGYHSFQPETLMTAMHLLDLFFSKNFSNIEQRSTVYDQWALACFYMSCKVVEQRGTPLPLDRWCIDFAVCKATVLKLEFSLMQSFKFNYQFPTALTFLEYFKERMDISLYEDPTVLIIRAIADKDFLRFLPGEVAAALVLIYCSNPRSITQEGFQKLFQTTSEETIVNCAVMLLKLVKKCGIIFRASMVFTFVEYFKVKMNLTFVENPNDVVSHAYEVNLLFEYLPCDVAAAVILVFSTKPPGNTDSLYRACSEETVFKVAELMRGMMSQ